MVGGLNPLETLVISLPGLIKIVILAFCIKLLLNIMTLFKRLVLALEKIADKGETQ